MMLLAQEPGFPELPLPVLVVLAVAGVVLLLALFFTLKFFQLWLQAFLAAAPISLLQLVGMSLRRVDLKKIVRSRIMAVQAGLSGEQAVNTHALESHYLAGGDVERVVQSMIAGKQEGIPISFKQAAAQDLANGQVFGMPDSQTLLAKTGSAQSHIGSLGSIHVEGTRMDAVSLSGPIKAGERIEIVEFRGNIAVVRRVY